MIIIPTYLLVCEQCGKHGRFISPDGTRSDEFCTKETALRELDKLLSNGKISDEEFRFLRTCVLTSQIEAEEYVPQLAKLACSILNEISEDEDKTDESDTKRPYLM